MVFAKNIARAFSQLMIFLPFYLVTPNHSSLNNDFGVFPCTRALLPQAFILLPHWGARLLNKYLLRGP